MVIQHIPNQIIKKTLQPLKLSKVDSIALHHMATDADIKQIEAMHIAQGWSAIGYNFWVGFDGVVYQGRGFNVGAGVKNQNSHIISIGFQGDYHNKKRAMPDAQFNAGIDIINYVLSQVPTIKKIGGHKDFMATACPGQYFPLSEMQSLQKRGDLTVSQYETLLNEIKKLQDAQEKVYHYGKDVPDWGKATLQKLMNKGLYKGSSDSDLNLPESMLRVLVINDRAGLYDK